MPDGTTFCLDRIEVFDGARLAAELTDFERMGPMSMRSPAPAAKCALPKTNNGGMGEGP